MALDEIATSIEASPEQVGAARRKRDKLDREFRDQVVENVEERTAQFQKFIDEMNEIIDDIGRDSPLNGVKKLKEIVDTAAAVLSTPES